MARRLVIMNICMIVGALILAVLTNPEQLPAAALIVMFVLLYGFCYSSLALIGTVSQKMEVITWTNRRITRTALAIACLPIFLLVLQSVGQLTVKDVLLTLGLFILLYVYFGRVLAQRST